MIKNCSDFKKQEKKSSKNNNPVAFATKNKKRELNRPKMGLKCKKQETKYIFPQYKDALAKRAEKNMVFCAFCCNFSSGTGGEHGEMKESEKFV